MGSQLLGHALAEAADGEFAGAVVDQAGVGLVAGDAVAMSLSASERGGWEWACSKYLEAANSLPPPPCSIMCLAAT